jgi:hypothetical protein
MVKRAFRKKPNPKKAVLDHLNHNSNNYPKEQNRLLPYLKGKIVFLFKS